MKRASRSGPPSSRPTSTFSDGHWEPEFDVVDEESLLEGRRTDVQAALLSRLRRGEWAPETRLDLHGLTVDEASEAVFRFVRREAELGRRVVLIVTGRGEHSPSGRGRIRGEIAHWLTAGPCSPEILCFATARPEHGGAGAVYVLLRRSGASRLP